jgi:hypothetical protein
MTDIISLMIGNPKCLVLTGQGNNISIFSKLGSGPGEYKEIKDVQIDFEKTNLKF